MYFTRILSLSLIGLAVAGSVPSTLLEPKHILRPANGASKSVIKGLLNARGPAALSSRQSSGGCDVGYSVCHSDYCCPTKGDCCTGGFCCDAGTYCDTVDGQLGCCETGKICTETSDECSTTGYSLCPNENYCCPTGTTCTRGADNMPSCSNSGGGGGGGSSFGGSPSTSRTPPATSSIVFSSPTFRPSSTPASTPTGLQNGDDTSTGNSGGGGGLSGLTGAGVRAWGDMRALAALPVLGFAAAFVL